MRLKEGLDLKVYQDKFGINLYAKNKKLIDNWINRGLLTLDNNHLCFTNQGFFVSNSFFRRYFSITLDTVENVVYNFIITQGNRLLTKKR